MTKIPFWPVLGAAYRFTFGDLGRFMAMSGVWFFVFIAIALAIIWQAQSEPFADSSLLAAQLGQFAALSAFAVAWHRAILMDEAGGLRFGRREVRFFGYSFLMMVGSNAVLHAGGLVLLLLFTAGILVAGAYPVPWQRMLIFQLVELLVLLGPLAGLLLVLPAVALDEQEGVFAKAWQRSRGNRLLLFYGVVLSALPFAVVDKVKQAVLGEPLWPAYAYDGRVPVPHPSAAAQCIAAAVEALLLFLGTAVVIGFLSFAYRHLASSPDGRRRRSESAVAF
ncbi:MAG TPA: hypothetical protein VF502_11675 [Stellaceae bacterium]